MIEVLIASLRPPLQKSSGTKSSHKGDGTRDDCRRVHGRGSTSRLRAGGVGGVGAVGAVAVGASTVRAVAAGSGHASWERARGVTVFRGLGGQTGQGGGVGEGVLGRRS